MTPEAASKLFALFVSAVPGHIVPRYGTAGGIVGGKRPLLPENERKPGRSFGPVELDPRKVVGIPHAEHQKYRREYARAIANGALTVRKVDEYAAQQTEIEKTETAARAKAPPPIPKPPKPE